MGMVNWIGNKVQSGAKNITLSARSASGLDNEITKYEKKGYTRIGQPYTGREGGPYGPMTFYQSMTTTDKNSEAIQKKNNKNTLVMIAIVAGIVIIPLGIIELIAYLAYKSRK